jgi:hypothetical protein
MKCPYIYPREEDWIVDALVREGEKVLVVGVRGSGVSTLLERLVKLSPRKLTRAGSFSEAVELCRRGSYVVYDTHDVGEAVELVSSCKRCVVGLSLPLLDLARLPSRLPAGVKVVVLKPLSPSELYDYLSNVLGVKLEEQDLLGEIAWRTGGFPGPICETVVSKNMFSTLVRWKDVKLFGDMPSWLREALEQAPDQLKTLALHVFLARFDEDTARELNVPTSAEWLERLETGELAVWPELLWLQPILQKLYPSEALKAYRAGLRRCRDSYLCFLYASSLYSVEGGRDYAAKAIAYAEKALEDVKDPITRLRLARRALELALEVQPSRAPYWLRALIEVYETVEPAPPEVGWMLSIIKKLRENGIVDPNTYAELVLQLGSMLTRWGKVEELEALVSELEALLAKPTSLGADVKAVEQAYLLLFASRLVLSHSWRRAETVLREATSILPLRGTSRRLYYQLMAYTLAVLGKLDELEALIRDASTTLSRFEIEDLKALHRFLSLNSSEEARSFVKTYSAAATPLARTLAAILEAFTAKHSRRIVHPVWLNTILLAVDLIKRGRIGEAYTLIEPVKADAPQLALVVLDLAIATLSPQKADPTTVVSVLEQLREELKRAQLLGAAKVVERLATAVRRGNTKRVQLELAKLLAYSLL